MKLKALHKSVALAALLVGAGVLSTGSYAADGVATGDTSKMKIAFSNSYAGNSFRQVMMKNFDSMGQQAIKDQLKANTDEVMARGGFGSPTIFVDKTDMYFGNDRLPLIRDALARRKASAA